MAKIAYTDLLTQDRFNSTYGGSGIYTVNSNGKSGRYHDFSGGEIDFKGRGLVTQSGGGLVLEKGTITHAVFTYDGGTMATIDGSLTVKQLNTGFHSFGDILQKFLAKDDQITGSSGNDQHVFGYAGDDKINGKGGEDIINGGKGNDTLTGGAGNDVFEFGVGFGKDKISDFDAEGGAGLQDIVHLLNGAEYTLVENSHGDAVVRISNKDALTLVGVGIDQIDGSDFFGG